MSDQDFFFDEEETAVEPKPGKDADTKPSANRSAKATPTARPAASKSVGKPASKPASKPAARPAPAAGGPTFFEQNVSMTIASLMTVIGLLVGVIIGFIAAPDNATVSTGTSAAPTMSGTGATAPQLSDEQLSSGTLPEGHPDISSMGATGTAETPSQ